MRIMVIRCAIVTSAFLFCLSISLTPSQAQETTGFRASSTATPSTTKTAQPSNQAGFQTGSSSATTKITPNQLPAGLKKAIVVEPDRPWKLGSRIHLEKGTNKGYLVVQLDLDEGYHAYSLNPKGSPSPTRLAVLPSNDLKVQSKFVSDKPPIVIEKDPVFGQRIEKHKGQVQFFASIVVRPGVDLQKLSQEVQFSGQICSDNACQPIRGKNVSAKFAGFFEVPKTRSASSVQPLK